MEHREVASVLILEDEELILLDVEECLRQTGFEIAGSFSTAISALGWLRVNTADVALLDLRLRDGECTEIARLLRDRGIPFLMHSGAAYDPEEHDAVFSSVRWLSKPCSSENMISALNALLSHDRR